MIAAIVAAASAAAAPAPKLDWMAGDWVSCTAEEVVEERWLGPSRDALVGVNLTRTPKGDSFEFIRVGQGARGLAYIAQPGGRTPVEFTLVEARDGYARFENPGHDFPRRIVYRREGELLFAAATGLDDNGPSWRFRRGDASACPKP
jgi:hypothetical protein